MPYYLNREANDNKRVHDVPKPQEFTIEAWKGNSEHNKHTVRLVYKFSCIPNYWDDGCSIFLTLVLAEESYCVAEFNDQVSLPSLFYISCIAIESRGTFLSKFSDRRPLRHPNFICLSYLKEGVRLWVHLVLCVSVYVWVYVAVIMSPASTSN
jgi:hypothetical protein